MGRLALKKMRFLESWIAPFICAILLAGLIIYLNRPEVPSARQLEDYLRNSNLYLAHDTVNGYSQIYYIYNEVKVYITSGGVNHKNPVSSGRYAAWQEMAQNGSNLVVYDLLNRTKNQITFDGYNSEARSDGSRLVWERVLNEKSQIYFFDGKKAAHISDAAFESKRPDIEDRKIVYARQIAGNSWQNIIYDIDSKREVVHSVGGKAQSFPRFDNGQIRTRF